LVQGIALSLHGISVLVADIMKVERRPAGPISGAVAEIPFGPA